MESPWTMEESANQKTFHLFYLLHVPSRLVVDPHYEKMDNCDVRINRFELDSIEASHCLDECISSSTIVPSDYEVE
jgi:hypothetical protein